MATRIRLQRHGRKSRPIFHIVVADSRAKRDGRFIEALGIYNPNTNPATIDINFERALEWMMTGAEPSDTARAILSHKGILMKKHLLEGVKKGALTLKQVEERFEKWLNEKQALVDNKVTSLMTSAQKNKADRLKAETESNAKKASAIAAKLAMMSNAALETAEAAAAEANAEETPEASAEAASEVAAEADSEVTTEVADAQTLYTQLAQTHNFTLPVDRLRPAINGEFAPWPAPLRACVPQGCPARVAAAHTCAVPPYR